MTSVGENLKSSSLWTLHPERVRVDVVDFSTHMIVTPVSEVKLVYWLTSSQTIVKDPIIRRCFGGRNFCWLCPSTCNLSRFRSKVTENSRTSGFTAPIVTGFVPPS